ncbi:Frataxin [Eremomyces bilateralis CBS 781.70]|uniref:ferroxidase n=1 Tax=Eremomyces bilateralis CBS 781.70 TaxID=1392243 RepID=A0A6G1FTI4_9PEZI|nr:Frataxin [Eremomyces bilateralis CBS 781.70]KAF1809107.1 Frataxin [Eremomyces bilateralis CBS 781.70]
MRDRVSIRLPSQTISKRPNPVPAWSQSRLIHSTRACYGILPKPMDTKQPDESTSKNSIEGKPVELSMDDYNERANIYLDTLVVRLEEMQEKQGGFEVDFSAGVMEIEIASKGTYVLNKQPPNRQIWLSSPISGPKRYDWVVKGEGMHDKAGAGQGEWIYLRDGSSLTDLLRKEIGVAMDDGLAEA